MENSVLAPGAHVVTTRKGDDGSAPMSIVVLQGQTTLLRAKSSRLGRTIHVEIEPRSAAVAFDGVRVGVGRADLRVPLGTHLLEARERGYFPATASVESIESANEAPVVRLSLVADPADPRWPTIRANGVRFAEAVRAAGGSVDVVDLPEHGIRGNSHMMMMDRNSDQVAQLIQDWLARKGLWR